jgi:predicted MFS family arabinose efflux permease
VPYAPAGAGILLASAALGMLTGDIVAGRFLAPAWRRRLAPVLRLLLAVPYLPFVLQPAVPLAAVLAGVAAIGYASTLLLQERLLALAPADARGQALGLHTSGMLSMQAVGAAIAGLVAQYTSPATAITVMASASVAVTLALLPGLRDRSPLARPADLVKSV